MQRDIDSVLRRSVSIHMNAHKGMTDRDVAHVWRTSERAMGTRESTRCRAAVLLLQDLLLHQLLQAIDMLEQTIEGRCL